MEITTKRRCPFEAGACGAVRYPCLHTSNRRKGLLKLGAMENKIKWGRAAWKWKGVTVTLETLSSVFFKRECDTDNCNGARSKEHPFSCAAHFHLKSGTIS